MMDADIARLESRELQRQNEGIELIASENYPSKNVRLATGSIFTAKYAEGYPGRRYYGGCSVVDELETLAIERCKKLFHVSYVNVQPHSGSQANYAAYRALLENKGKILSLALNDGGHLTHGSRVSFSANEYDFAFYPLGDDGRLDYGIIKRRLDEERPDLFLAGYSAYPFNIDFKKIREIIDAHNESTGSHCLFMVDMAHIAGQVATGRCQNPCDYADLVTSTTHKTLRGPRGGIILSNRLDLAKKIDAAVFPYSQGGPLEHVIAAKAVAFAEADTEAFREYYDCLLQNTKACNDELARLGCEVSGTENHLFLLDVLSSFGINGLEAQTRLEEVGITVNKNMIHGDTLPPKYASGIRIGFAAATSRGCTVSQAEEIARVIFEALSNPKSDPLSLRNKAKALTSSWKNIAEIEY